MEGEQGERWMQPCKQAAVEQDPKKLVALIDEINRLLEAKEQRLLQLRGSSAHMPKASDTATSALSGHELFRKN